MASSKLQKKGASRRAWRIANSATFTSGQAKEKVKAGNRENGAELGGGESG